MAETKKLTKKDYFIQLREIVKDNAELVAFIDHEVELLTRKNSGNSQTKTQKDNEVICEVLISIFLTTHPGVSDQDQGFGKCKIV